MFVCLLHVLSSICKNSYGRILRVAGRSQLTNDGRLGEGDGLYSTMRMPARVPRDHEELLSDRTDHHVIVKVLFRAINIL